MNPSVDRLCIPPLKQTIGAVMPRGAVNMRKPRGGRLLISEKSIPFARSAAAAALVRSVRTFSLVTNVPSTSEITAEHLTGRRAGPRHDDLPSPPSTPRHFRPSFANSASASLGPALPDG